jgi:predicted RNA-binding Zn ribbon-like protein
MPLPVSPSSVEPPLIGDHPALDLLNTVVRTPGGLLDTWQQDDDVLRWLARTGLLAVKTTPRLRRGALLAAARSLREIVRRLVVAHKSGKRLDPAALNRFLAKTGGHEELLRAGAGLSVTRRYDLTTAEGVLAPLAKSAAGLLAYGDFDLIRHCEGVDCVLWFYDRTKAHRRRWCSMAVCGNRNKIAGFRARQQR